MQPSLKLWAIKSYKKLQKAHLRLGHLSKYEVFYLWRPTLWASSFCGWSWCTVRGSVYNFCHIHSHSNIWHYSYQTLSRPVWTNEWRNCHVGLICQFLVTKAILFPHQTFSIHCKLGFASHPNCFLFYTKSLWIQLETYTVQLSLLNLSDILRHKYVLVRTTLGQTLDMSTDH